MLREAKQEHDRATAENALDKLIVYAGSSVGLLKSRDHAEDAINNLVHDMMTIFKKGAKLAGTGLSEHD